MSDFFWFSDAQWARIASLLPTDTRGMARVDDRRVLSGIVHALRNGGRWADCPREVYGPKKTLYNRFVRWAERGIWERIFSALAGGEDAPDRVCPIVCVSDAVGDIVSGLSALRPESDPRTGSQTAPLRRSIQ